MNVTVNNEPMTIDESTTVDRLVSSLFESTGGIAVAINGSIVKKSQWSEHAIKENDDIVIIKAAYGG